MDFAVAEQQDATGAVLVVTGELDIATAPTLVEAVTAALAGSPRRLLVDLSRTGFIDSTGCRLLVRAAKAGLAARVPVALVVPPSNWRVRRVIDFMQFGELLPVHDALPDA